MFDLVRGILREVVAVGWFLRDRGVELKDGGEFGIVGGVGTNMEGGAGGGWGRGVGNMTTTMTNEVEGVGGSIVYIIICKNII